MLYTRLAVMRRASRMRRTSRIRPVSLLRRTTRRWQSACLAGVAFVGVTSACERIVDPLSGNGRATRARLGDFVLSTVSVQAPDSLRQGDTLVMQLQFGEVPPCSYATHVWIVTQGVVLIAPFGVRYPGTSCPRPRVTVPMFGGSTPHHSCVAGTCTAVAPRDTSEQGVVSVPWRIVACRPDADPIWRVVHLQTPWNTAQEHDYAVHWRDSLTADIQAGRAIGWDRAACSTMVSQGL